MTKSMKIGFRKFAFVLTPPLLSVGLLAGIVTEQRTHLKPKDVEPYHAAARAAVEKVPYLIDGGRWTGTDEEIPTAAQKLLRPNAILSRLYSDNSPATANLSPIELRNHQRVAHLLIVQCRDSRDMTGHYPPICYRNIGHELVRTDRHPPLDVGGTPVPYTEYKFEKYTHGRAETIFVYDFFVVPGRGAVDDIKGVYDAAEDYERRFFGAAQFQVVMQEAVVPDARVRHEVFAALIRSSPTLIATLTTDGMKP